MTVPVHLEKDCAAVDEIAVPFVHGAGAGLWCKNAVVVSAHSKLRLKELFELVRFYLLQAHNVGIIGQDLVQDHLLANFPREIPGGDVAVLLRAGILFGQNVVTQKGKRVIQRH